MGGQWAKSIDLGGGGAGDLLRRRIERNQGDTAVGTAVNTASSTASRRRRPLIGDALRPVGRRQWRVATARFASDRVVVGEVQSDEVTGVNVGRATLAGGSVEVDWLEVTRRARNDAIGMRSRGAMANAITEETAGPTVRSGRCCRSFGLPITTEKSHCD